MKVEPWGKWRIWARDDGFEALVEATCDQPGTPLRAPTPTEGLQPACRDSFAGQVNVSDICSTCALTTWLKVPCWLPRRCVHLQ